MERINNCYYATDLLKRMDESLAEIDTYLSKPHKDGSFAAERAAGALKYNLGQLRTTFSVLCPDCLEEAIDRMKGGEID